MLIWKRKRKLPDGTHREDKTYSYRLDWQGKQIPRKTPFTNYDEAEKAARAHLHALQVGAYDVAEALRRRKAPVQLGLQPVLEAYLAAPAAPRRAAVDTRIANLHALSAVLRASDIVLEMDGQKITTPAGVEVLTATVIWKFKETVEQKAAEESEERQAQLYRSANSLLRQARSPFSKDMLEHYGRATPHRLPDLQKFLTTPGFKGVQKLEYHPPPDAIITKTFESLDGLAEADPNVFKACWLALGFGLRAGEIAQARRNWLITLDGAHWCAGSELAKNKKFPRVRVQLGAWQKLAPLIEALPGEAFLLTGNDTERASDVFRRISAWMRSLGWRTQHHIHELRAYAGCQIAERSPRQLLDAQTFLRHAHFSTTEKFYGHHMKRRLEEVTLKLPAAATPAPLQVVNGGATP
jgi:integrase